MPGLDIKRLAIAYVVTVLHQSELIVSLDELFPSYVGPTGTKRVIGRKLQRLLVRNLEEDRLIRVVKIGNEEFYEKINLKALRELSATEDEVADLASFFGISVDEMKDQRYSAVMAERKAKTAVSIAALKKLLDFSEPHTRASLFKAKRGHKYEERAVWTTAWQFLLLEALEKIGAINSIPGNPVKYEAANRDLLQRIASWKESGPNCLFTLLHPNEPCTTDHSLLKDPYRNSISESESTPSEPSELPATEVLDSVPKLLSDPETSANSASEASTSEEVSALEIQKEILASMGSLSELVISLSKSQTGFFKLLESVSVKMHVMEMHHNAAGLLFDKMRQKIEKSDDDTTSAFVNQINSMKKRISEMEKIISSESVNTNNRHESIKKSISELAIMIVNQNSVSSLESSKPKTGASRRPSSAILKMLSTAAEDLDTLKDLALDSIHQSEPAS